MRKALVLIFALVFLTPCNCFAIPAESVPSSNVQPNGEITAGVPPVGPTVKLPGDSVHMYLRDGATSRFELFFIDARYGWGIEDYEFYRVWCLEKGKPLYKNSLHKVRLYNYSAPDLPPRLRTMDFNRINYIINHRPESVSKEAVQQAIWHFSMHKNIGKPGPEAAQLIKEAEEKGKDYVPAGGDLVVVICVPEKETKQATILEFRLPAIESQVIDAAVPAALVAGGSYGWAGLPLIAAPLAFIGGGGHGHDKPTPPPSPPVVPEPGAFLFLAVGAFGLLALRLIRTNSLRRKTAEGRH